MFLKSSWPIFTATLKICNHTKSIPFTWDRRLKKLKPLSSKKFVYSIHLYNAVMVIYFFAMISAIRRFWDALTFANQMTTVTFVEGTYAFFLIQLNLTLYKVDTVNFINALLAYEGHW